MTLCEHDSLSEIEASFLCDHNPYYAPDPEPTFPECACPIGQIMIVDSHLDLCGRCQVADLSRVTFAPTASLRFSELDKEA